MRSPTISIYKLNSNSASFGRFLEGDELRVCYDTETEFPTGLAWVKAETLSRAVGLAGLGRVTSRVTGLRHFPYLRVIELLRFGRLKLR
jgi:hypothetical protein